MISRTGLHAIRALVLLARQPQGTYMRTPTIASEIHAPKNYLGKLLQLLAHEGIVHSQRGHGGGFCLARAPQKIRLLEVIEPFDHISKQPQCILQWRQCSDKHPCAMHEKWSRIRDAFHGLLHDTTLADLACGDVMLDEPAGA